MIFFDHSIIHTPVFQQLDLRAIGGQMGYTCCGTTKKGLPCKISVPDNPGYCHYHRPLNSTKKLPQLVYSFAKLSVKPDTQELDSPAYIYIYTLSAEHRNVHIHSGSSFEPLHKPKSGIRKLLHLPTKPSPQTLIKIGYTTTTPKIRLQQWKRQCGHPVFLIGPEGNATKKGFNEEMMGWPMKKNKATVVEKEIHRIMWQRYGKGTVECEGCAGGSEVNGADKPTKRKKHVEWFLIPNNKKVLNEVYGLVDEIIEKT